MRNTIWRRFPTLLQKFHFISLFISVCNRKLLSLAHLVSLCWSTSLEETSRNFKKKEERKKEKIAHWVWFGIRKLVNCLSILFFFCDNFLTAIIIISLFHCLIHRGIQILQSQIAYPTLLRALTRLANHFNFRLIHIRLNCN